MTKLENFINKANIIHDNRYSYDKSIYINAKIKLLITCVKHEKFLQTPNMHLSQKNGCPKCSNKLKTYKEFEKDCNIKHNKKFTYFQDYVNVNHNIKIKCSNNHIFFQRAGNHQHLKHGCPHCKKEKMSFKFRKDIKDYIKEASRIHNNKYDYSKVNYTNMNKKVIIICPQHGEFNQSFKNHVRGEQGCPKCKSSKGERFIRNILDKNNIKYIEQYRVIYEMKLYIFDFYLPSRNIMIEYDGIQHQRPVNFFGGKKIFKNQQLIDMIKDQYCDVMNIKLIRVNHEKEIRESI